MRQLIYVVVELGACKHCGRDAGDHSIEGLCAPHGTPHQRDAGVPEQCYRGAPAYAFIDQDKPAS